KNYPPSPKAMEDRGIINYCRCRACGTTNKMLDASSLSLLCMTLKEFCCGDRNNPNSSFRA
ncbi:MAG: hypothetical protein IJW31_09855, partial [Lentisphaeria bacterium]|nr:hypothetical protein [Lentisphaeria bacterium]